MYVEARYTRSAKYDRANILSKFLFLYVYPILWRGYKNNGIQMDDLDHCPAAEESENVADKLLKNWTQEVKSSKKDPSLAWALIRTFGPTFVFPFLVCLYEECLIRLAQPLLLGQMIKYFTSSDPEKEFGITKTWAWIYTAGVCLCSFLYVGTHHLVMQHCMRIGMRARTACCALIYDKTLRLSQSALNEGAQVGQIVNIMSNDVNRFDELGNFAPYLVAAPVQTLIIVYFVWTYLGVASLAGVLMLVLFMPFQGLMGKLFSKVRNSTAKRTDTRLRFMNEIISGIRVIKMYCWEKPFANKISKARKAEVSKIRQSLFLKAINLSIFYVYTRLVLFVCFVIFVLVSNEKLNAEAVFVTMSMFNIVRSILTYLFPMAVSLTSELQITCRRIEKFLLLEEKQDLITEKSSNSKSSNSQSLQVQNISSRWSKQSLTLNNISIDLKPGDLLAVIGPVGSGKSSFLMSLLGELPLESGQILLNGSLSYASQQAWSISDTVRHNILFGSEYDQDKYEKVMQVCALQRDLQLMDSGDETLVGEKGVSLSGGQKARINLARAVYRDGDVVLMDDPLSAVDAPVAKHIFEECILEHLKYKIRILVTHQVQFIEQATKILVLNDGKPLAYGSYQEIQHLGIDFENLLCSMKSKIVEENNENPKDSESKTVDKGTDKPKNEKSKNIKTTKKLEEKSQHGSMSWRTYLEYIKAGDSFILWILVVLFSIISQAIMNGSDIFLAYWTNKTQQESINQSKDSQTQDIIIYSSLILALFITTIFRSFTFFAVSMRASVKIHNRIFDKLVQASVIFFDSNPTGRILNRFSKDLGIVDESLPNRAYDMTLNLTQAIGVMVTVSIVNWYLVIPALITMSIMIYYRKIYGKSAFDIKRFEGLARSPIYSQVSTTMSGLASIRAFGVQSAFWRQFNIYQNDHSATWFIYISCSRAVDLFTGWTSSVYISIITVSMMFVSDNLGGNAGLAISSGILFTSLTQWAMRHTMEFENQMTSVERLLEYQDLPQEPKSTVESVDPLWPTTGQIEYDKLCLTYDSEERPVLRNITCKISGGEKIGIVGRTGAGKSSMIAALFRLTEPSSGKILIDGLSIEKINLDILRKKISIIPQEPVIFSGTVRDNLDPFHEYKDSDLWEALEKVQLKSHFSSNLLTELSENGSNLSVGQRQLLCLARALLRGNKILILDEATASVDHQTDQLIQRTIRSEFTDCTVLTVAHRLNTIIDSDRVMVLDAGEIVEFAHPQQLLEDKNGVFHEMCRKSGPEMYEHLCDTINHPI